MLRPRLSWAVATSLPLLLAAGCGAGSGDEAGGAEAAESAPGWGLVVIPDDPAHRGVAPEELESRGVRAYFHDFGKTPAGSVVEHVFRLENTNPGPVTIQRMQPSCGCTTPSIRYTSADGEVVQGKSRGDVLTIPPGVVADLTMQIDTKRVERQNVDKIYTVQMVTDSPTRAFLRLEAHLFVESAFQLNPTLLNVGRIPRNAGGRGQIEILAFGGVGATIDGVGELPGGVEASVEATDMFGAPFWTVSITLLPPLPPGPLRRTFELETLDRDGMPYHPVPIEVHAFVVDDIEWSPLRFVLRNAAVADGPVSESLEIYSLLEGDRIKVTGATLIGAGTEALELTFAPVTPDANGKSVKWTLNLATKPPFPDEIVRGKAKIELADRDPVEIELIVNPR
ncbi:MAG: DUF1573 domain-containing protein [Planctomycetota bacterium]